MSDHESALNIRNGSPLMDGLGLRVVVEDGHPVVRVEIDQRHLRSHNIAHGGVICTVLDTAMGAAAYSAMQQRLTESTARGASAGGPMELVTSQLTIHFIRPAWNGESILGRGEIVHHGTKTIVVRGEVSTTDGKLIASGSGTFMPVTIDATPT